MDEILHSHGRQPSEPAYRVVETGAPAAPRTARDRLHRMADGLTVAGRAVSGVLHRADSAVAGRKLLGPLVFLLIAGVLGVALVLKTVYIPAYVVTVDGAEVPLTRTEFNIVELLAAHPRKVYTKQELFELAWGEP